jgi:hypothetical protein
MKRLLMWLVPLVLLSWLVTGVPDAGGAPKRPAQKAPKAVAPAARAHTAKKRGHKPHPRGAVAVSVVDQKGLPVTGATVHLRKIAPHKKKVAKQMPGAHAAVVAHGAGKHHVRRHPPHRAGRTATTDAQGRASFQNVKVGHFRDTAHKKGVGTGRTHAAVHAGQTTEVTIRLVRHAHGHRAAANRGVLNRRPHPQVAPHAPVAPRAPAARKR